MDALRKGRKECPTCRTKMASHRDMRSEPRIDFILGTLLGDLDEWEDENELQVQKLTESLNMDSLRKSVEKGLSRQSGSKRKKPTNSSTSSNKYVNNYTLCLVNTILILYIHFSDRN